MSMARKGFIFVCLHVVINKYKEAKRRIFHIIIIICKQTTFSREAVGIVRKHILRLAQEFLDCIKISHDEV